MAHLTGSNITRRKLLTYLKGHRIDELLIEVRTVDVTSWGDTWRQVQPTGQFTFTLSTTKRKENR